MDDDNSGIVEINELKKAFKKVNFDAGMNKSDMYDSPKSSLGSLSHLMRNNSSLSKGSGLS